MRAALIKLSLVTALLVSAAVHARGERGSAMTWAVLSAAIVAVAASSITPPASSATDVLGSRFDPRAGAPFDGAAPGDALLR